MFRCNNCGGWDESEYPWDGDYGYACTCILCEGCGEAVGNSLESQEWNDEQFRQHWLGSIAALEA